LYRHLSLRHVYTSEKITYICVKTLPQESSHTPISNVAEKLASFDGSGNEQFNIVKEYKSTSQVLSAEIKRGEKKELKGKP
jgi:hypothetical protein